MREVKATGRRPWPESWERTPPMANAEASVKRTQGCVRSLLGMASTGAEVTRDLRLASASCCGAVQV